MVGVSRVLRGTESSSIPTGPPVIVAMTRCSCVLVMISFRGLWTKQYNHIPNLDDCKHKENTPLVEWLLPREVCYYLLMSNKGLVQLEWMGKLGWKQQSVILSALRGPDNHYSPNVKKISRWIRSITQNNADPTHSYMKSVDLPSVKECEDELYFASTHYSLHLVFALEIIGYKHPDKETRSIALGYYLAFVEDIYHMKPETEADLDARLKDRV